MPLSSGYRFALAEIKCFLFVMLRSVEFSHPVPRPDYFHRVNLVQRPVVRDRADEGYQLRLKLTPLQELEEL